MKPALAALALAAFGLSACAGAKPAPTCQLEFLFKAPERPHERLAELDEMVRIVPAGGAHEALRPQACALGADAVVVTKTMVVNLLDHTSVQGYAIRWKAPPPLTAPAAPAAPAEVPPPAPAPEKPLQL